MRSDPIQPARLSKGPGGRQTSQAGVPYFAHCQS